MSSHHCFIVFDLNTSRFVFLGVYSGLQIMNLNGRRTVGIWILLWGPFSYWFSDGGYECEYES